MNEEIRIPEKVAPLLNGRCGNDDELKAIQAQSNCKITFSRESGSLARYIINYLNNIMLVTKIECYENPNDIVIEITDRCCTLNGQKESVAHAKDLINKLCNENNAGSVEMISCMSVPPAGTNGYPPYVEIMVPGSKVGLVIGKGGETIKMLQEKTGAKMVIIQDGPGQELVRKIFVITKCDPMYITFSF